MKFRSVKSIVIAPAKTGRDSRRRVAVTIKDQTNRDNRSHETPGARILRIVVMKFTAPKIELIPAKCKEKIARSTEWLLWPIRLLRGGYTVHPAPTPPSTNEETNSRIIAGGKNQKLMLLSRGKAISWAPTNIGSIQLPNPPISTGITKKKIITKACAVTNTLYKWGDPKTIPVLPSSIRINTEKADPIRALQSPNKRYRVPMSLWFVENAHRTF